MAAEPVSASGKAAKAPSSPMAPQLDAKLPARMLPGLLFRQEREPPSLWKLRPMSSV